MADCDCGAPTEGKYANVHAPACASLTLRERLKNAVDQPTDAKALKFLCAEALTLIEEFEHFGPFDAETLADMKRMLPIGLYDAGGAITRNPVTQVYFRAGLLACREYMARFVEQGGDATTAASIRANWWPVLGDDPGPPRLFDFSEVCDEIEQADGTVRYESKEVPPSIEALPRAYQFLLPAVQSGESSEAAE